MMLVAGMLVRFQHVIPILVLAPILTIIVVPVVQFMCVRLKIPWGLAATIAMLLFVLLLIGASTVLGFAIVQQLQALFLIVQQFLQSFHRHIISPNAQIFEPQRCHQVIALRPIGHHN